MENIMSLEDIRYCMSEFVFETALISKYLKGAYVMVENIDEIYMSENDGLEYFERLHKAFNYFINESGAFSWEKHNVIHDRAFINLVNYAQAVFDKEDCIYYADYYFEYDGVKYTLDIEKIAPDGVDGKYTKPNFVFCNICEFGDTFSRYDKKTNVIFVYDKDASKFVELRYVTKSRYEDSDIRISKVLNLSTVERVQKRILRNMSANC